MSWGNQYESRKKGFLNMLHSVRAQLSAGRVRSAQITLANWRTLMEGVPASTRRRWKCGR